MKGDFGMVGQEAIHEFGFMGGEVVCDNVDFRRRAVWRLPLGKVDELLAGMAASSLPMIWPLWVSRAAYRERVP